MSFSSPSPSAAAAAAASSSSVKIATPTMDRPWAVDAVAAMPVRVTTTSTSTTLSSPVDSCLASCCMGPWTCLLSRQEGQEQQEPPSSSGSQYVLHLWFTQSRLDMCQQKLSQPVLSFSHPFLLSNNHNNTQQHAAPQLAPLVAIYVSPVQPEWVYVYVATSITTAAAATGATGTGGGAVLLYKFAASDLQRSNSGSNAAGVDDNNNNTLSFPPAKDICQLPLLHNDDEYITSISVEWKQIVVGTSHGRLFWLRQFQNSLRAQLVQVNDGATSSLLSRLLFGSSSSSGKSSSWSPSSATSNGGAAICHILQLPSPAAATATTTTPGKTATSTSQQHFLSLTRAGCLQYWTATKPQEHAPHETFQSTTVSHLPNLLRPQKGTANKQIIPSFSSLETLRAEYQPSRLGGGHRGRRGRGGSLHVLVRVHHDQQHEEFRLYWLRLQEQAPAPPRHAASTTTPSRGGGTTTTTSSPPPPPQLALKMVLWLNRFVLPETVLPIGLVAAENGLTYAAFGVMPTSSAVAGGGVSPTLMALQVNDGDDMDDDGGYGHDGEGGGAAAAVHMTTTTTCPQLHEMDLHQVEALLVGSLTKDDRTHGCLVATTGGLFLRAECKASTTNSTSNNVVGVRRSNSGTSSSPSSTAQARSRINQLKNHLKSTFWDAFERGSISTSFASGSAMDESTQATLTPQTGGGTRFWSPAVPRTLPPSLKAAEPVEMGQVVTQLAMELQHDNEASSGVDIATRHLDFIEFLQQASIYRSLPLLAMWHLLVIGQEIAAYKALYATSRQASSSSAPAMAALFQMHPLDTKNVAAWLEKVQVALYETKNASDDSSSNVDDSTTTMEGTSVHVLQVAWLECFVTAVRAATLYSEERATFIYGIETNGSTTTTAAPTPPCTQARESVPIWTSKVALLRIFQRQLQYWQQSSSSSSSSSSLNDGGSKYDHVVSYGDLVQAVATAALQSFADSYRTIHPNSLAARLLAKSDYEAVQVQAIELLRKVKMSSNDDNDELAWMLSKQHCYFAGLCEISMDHEKDKAGSNDDNPFRLDPLFKELAFCQDLKTGLGFGRFVIKWHVDHNYLGHALQYGKHCPIDLSFLVQEEPALRPFQWVAAIRHEDFSTATQSLLNNAVQGGGEKGNNDYDNYNQQVSLSQVKFSLGMAKLANQVVLQEEMPGSVTKDMAIDREQSIESMRELASAQEQLLGDMHKTSKTSSSSSPSSPSSLWPPLKLLEYALNKVDECTVRDEKIDTCFIALVICTAIANKTLPGGTNNSSAIREAAARVWCKALLTDTELLHNLIPHVSTSTSSRTGRFLDDGDTMESAFHQSIFGSLVEKCSQVERWKHQQQQTGIGLDAAMERQILDCLNVEERPLVQGLLRHALTRV